MIYCEIEHKSIDSVCILVRILCVCVCVSEQLCRLTSKQQKFLITFQLTRIH